MMPQQAIHSIALTLSLLLGLPLPAMPLPARSTAPPTETLTSRQQALVSISALTAIGDLPRLQQALGEGLMAGLTVNQEKEVLVQLYAYCGFPRSINGLNTLLGVLQQRRAKGIIDVVGREASPITSTAPKYERGKQNLQKLTGKPEPEPKTGYSAFSPELDRFLKEHLFADIFERDLLTFQERELVTISALVALGGVEPMLQAHLGLGLNTGLSGAQLRQVLALEEAAVGLKQAAAARTILSTVLEARKL